MLHARGLCSGALIPQTSAHEEQVCAVMWPDMKWLRVACKPDSLPDWSVLQDLTQFSIKRNGLCWPKSVQLLPASSENSPWQGGGRPWDQDSCPGAGGIPMWVWRWVLKHPQSDVILRCSSAGETRQPSVLVSARTEVIFFLVAGIVLCFGFSRKIMLIIH